MRGYAAARLLGLRVKIPLGVWRGTLLVAQLVEALRYKPKGRGFDS
jgi:hypothetical protein